MNKWKTINKKIVYKNKFLSIREDDVIDPNGNKGKRNIIEAGAGSVVVIAQKENGELYLVGQSRYAVNEYSWEFVSGGIKKGENELKAAKRELAEELNLKAKKWEKILSFHPNNSLMNREVYVFLAEDLLSANNSNFRDSYERINKKTVSISKIKNNIKKGAIKDGFTICSFYSYLQRKEEKNKAS